MKKEVESISEGNDVLEKPVVDYLKVVADYSGDKCPSYNATEPPEQAGAIVVDYMAVSEWWKEVKGRMCRVDQEEKGCGTEH